MKKQEKKNKKEDKILVEIKRHNEVLMEQQVKTVAEQHSSLIVRLDKHDRRFDTLELELNEEIKELKTGQKELKSGVEILKTGQEGLRLDVEILKSGQERIEQKLDTKLIDHEIRIEKIEEKVGIV